MPAVQGMTLPEPAQEFWSSHNFTDHHDGWDHQSDRLGTVIGVADDGRSCEVVPLPAIADCTPAVR
jgi:hypothetical protein